MRQTVNGTMISQHPCIIVGDSSSVCHLLMSPTVPRDAFLRVSHHAACPTYRNLELISSGEVLQYGEDRRRDATPRTNRKDYERGPDMPVLRNATQDVYEIVCWQIC